MTDLEKSKSIFEFDEYQVRREWDKENEKWWLCIVDVVAVLTEQLDYQVARSYWKKLKQRLREEGNETVTNCHRLKIPTTDGKMRLMDVADTEQILRLIQSIPSKKAVKQYKDYKGLKKENLRDNMSTLELVLNMLAEATTTEISKEQQPETFEENRAVARSGGRVAGNARKEIEATTGKPVITSKNAVDFSTLITNMIEDANSTENQ
jgi:hypothetical protein